MVRILRTFTGCLTCRHRRKKCDERKPVCSDCLRLRLSCVWTNASAKSATPSIAAVASKQSSHRNVEVEHTTSALLYYQKGSVVNGYEVFENDTERHLAIQCPDLLSAISTPIDIVSGNDLRLLMSLALSQPVVRYAYAAFAAQMLAVENPNLQPTAARYYSRALSRQRSYIQQHEDGGDPGVVMTMAMLLGLYEAVGGGSVQNAFIHFIAVLQLARRCLTNGKATGAELSSNSQACRRACVKMTAHVTAGLVVGHTHHIHHTKKAPWRPEDELGSSKATSGPTASRGSLSPLFVYAQTEICCLLLYVGNLARRSKTLTVAQLRRQVRSVEAQITHMETTLQHRAKDILNKDGADRPPMDKSIMVLGHGAIAGVRMQLTVIANPNICSGSPVIRKSAGASLHVMKQIVAQLAAQKPGAAAKATQPDPATLAGLHRDVGRQAKENTNSGGGDDDMALSLSPDRTFALYWTVSVLLRVVHGWAEFETVAAFVPLLRGSLHKTHYDPLVELTEKIRERKRSNLHACVAGQTSSATSPSTAPTSPMSSPTSQESTTPSMGCESPGPDRDKILYQCSRHRHDGLDMLLLG